MASSQILRFAGNLDYANEGKCLWEILCQLRNFGVGRYMTKNEWLRKFPDQSSYIRILNVTPEMDRWLNRGRVIGEWTFRGHNLGIFEFTLETNRSDWKLIHKHEQKELAKAKEKMGSFEFPDSFPLPPLVAHMRKEVARKVGRKWEESQGRAPLKICIDPQNEIYRPFIKQAKPAKHGRTIYDETNKDAVLGMWGDELPVRIDAWNSGPAEIRSIFLKSKLSELTENTTDRNVIDSVPGENDIKMITNK